MPIADLLRTPLIALPLRNANFGIYSLGSAVSLTGMWMQRIAVGWLTWQLTESGFWLGVVAFADFFPVILIAPIAGAAADRWDRLRVVKISQFVLLVQAVGAVRATASGHVTVGLIVALTDHPWHRGRVQPAGAARAGTLAGAARRPWARRWRSIR